MKSISETLVWEYLSAQLDDRFLIQLPTKVKSYILKQISVRGIETNNNKFYLNILFMCIFIGKIAILVFINSNLRIAERAIFSSLFNITFKESEKLHSQTDF